MYTDNEQFKLQTINYVLTKKKLDKNSNLKKIIFKFNKRKFVTSLLFKKKEDTFLPYLANLIKNSYLNKDLILTHTHLFSVRIRHLGLFLKKEEENKKDLPFCALTSSKRPDPYNA